MDEEDRNSELEDRMVEINESERGKNETLYLVKDNYPFSSPLRP